MAYLVDLFSRAQCATCSYGCGGAHVIHAVLFEFAKYWVIRPHSDWHTLRMSKFVFEITALNPTSFVSHGLCGMSQIVEDEFTKESGQSCHMRMDVVVSLMNTYGDLTGRWQVIAVDRSSWFADAIGIIGRQRSGVRHVGVTPLGVLHIIAVTRVWPVLSRQTRDRHKWLKTFYA